MGDKKLDDATRRHIVVAVLFIIVTTLSLMLVLNAFDDTVEPSPVEPVRKTIIVMKASPVDNEPGAYILEYSNGVKEVLHADGTREILKFGKIEGH